MRCAPEIPYAFVPMREIKSEENCCDRAYAMQGDIGEMATGALPFRGESSGVILNAILDGTPASAARLNPDLPPKLEDIINKALEKDRNLRYQHAADLRADLQRLKRDIDSGRTAQTHMHVDPVISSPPL